MYVCEKEREREREREREIETQPPGALHLRRAVSALDEQWPWDQNSYRLDTLRFELMRADRAHASLVGRDEEEQQQYVCIYIYIYRYRGL